MARSSVRWRFQIIQHTANLICGTLMRSDRDGGRARTVAFRSVSDSRHLTHGGSHHPGLWSAPFGAREAPTRRGADPHLLQKVDLVDRRALSSSWASLQFRLYGAVCRRRETVIFNMTGLCRSRLLSRIGDIHEGEVKCVDQ